MFRKYPYSVEDKTSINLRKTKFEIEFRLNKYLYNEKRKCERFLCKKEKYDRFLEKYTDDYVFLVPSVTLHYDNRSGTMFRHGYLIETKRLDIFKSFLSQFRMANLNDLSFDKNLRLDKDLFKKSIKEEF